MSLWYHFFIIKLTQEQTDAAIQHPDGVECQGEGVEKTFILMDAEVVERMRATLYQKDVQTSIQAGVADMEAGRMVPAEEADGRVRSACQLPPRSAS